MPKSIVRNKQDRFAVAAPLISEKPRPDGSVITTAFGCLRLPAVSLLCLAGMLIPASRASAQASAAALRKGDLQVGGGFALANGDYGQGIYRGYSIYSSFDFKPNFGVEVDFHQVNQTQNSKRYERTYEIGGRYVRHYGILNPYARVMYGRGVFNYQGDVANLAYNMAILGAGVDVNVHRRVNVRADYEYQQWYGFKGVVNNQNGTITGSGTLSPQLFTIGAAYHF